MQFPSLPSMALRLVANLQSCLRFGVATSEIVLPLESLVSATLKQGVAGASGLCISAAQGFKAKVAIREFLVDRCIGLEIADDVIHADPAGIETCGVPIRVGTRCERNGFARVRLHPVKTAVDEAHGARVVLLDSARCSSKGVLVVYKREDGDELNRFRYAGLPSALGDGKGAALISTAKRAVAIVRIASGGGQDAEIPARRILRGTIRAVRHPVHLGAGGRRPSLPERTEASVGFRIQFGGLACVKAIVIVELVAEIAWPRVDLGERRASRHTSLCGHEPRHRENENANKRCFQ